jgi:hypothetical protein
VSTVVRFEIPSGEIFYVGYLIKTDRAFMILGAGQSSASIQSGPIKPGLQASS